MNEQEILREISSYMSGNMVKTKKDLSLFNELKLAKENNRDYISVKVDMLERIFKDFNIERNKLMEMLLREA